jgi:transcriptional regulator with XRE-family HTH domain
METLSEYVQRIMNEKNLRPIDVSRKSNGGIGDSHVTNILRGTTSNVTIDRLRALAVGLGVDSIELFKIAVGLPANELNVQVVARVFEKVVSNAELSKLFLLLDRMNQRQVKALLSVAEKALSK